MAVKASDGKPYYIPELISLLLALLCMLPFTAYAQTRIIEGKVVDSKTLLPLPYASVYLNNTTIGTATSPEGDFRLDELPFGEYELVVSYVGYRPYLTKVVIKGYFTTTMTIRLMPLPVNLDEINVNDHRARRKDNLCGSNVGRHSDQ